MRFKRQASGFGQRLRAWVMAMGINSWAGLGREPHVGWARDPDQLRVAALCCHAISMEREGSFHSLQSLALTVDGGETSESEGGRKESRYIKREQREREIGKGSWISLVCVANPLQDYKLYLRQPKMYLHIQKLYLCTFSFLFHFIYLSINYNFNS